MFTNLRQPPESITFPQGESIIQIFACWSSAVALSNSGNVYFWRGSNPGRSHDTPPPTPSIMAPPEGERFISIAGTAGHIAALTVAGLVYTWSELGDTPLSLQPLLSSCNATQLSGSLNHLIAFSSPGRFSIVNIGSTGVDATPTELLVQPPNSSNSVTSTVNAPVIQICAGDWHLGALREDGTVFTWGATSGGARGDGETDGENRGNPERIEVGLEGLHVFHLAMGGWTSAALAIVVDEDKWATSYGNTTAQASSASQPPPQNATGLPTGLGSIFSNFRFGFPQMG